MAVGSCQCPDGGLGPRPQDDLDRGVHRAAQLRLLAPQRLTGDERGGRVAGGVGQLGLPLGLDRAGDVLDEVPWPLCIRQRREVGPVVGAVGDHPPESADHFRLNVVPAREEGRVLFDGGPRLPALGSDVAREDLLGLADVLGVDPADDVGQAPPVDRRGVQVRGQTFGGLGVPVVRVLDVVPLRLDDLDHRRGEAHGVAPVVAALQGRPR